jgi:DNA-binding response OmpR family regulator
VPASHKSSAGTAGHVVLVEEYRPLAAAVVSALKKFAPQHRVTVVGTVAEAEQLLASDQPDLLIFDTDPPQHGTLSFFATAKAAAPDARALLLVADTDRQLLRELPRAGACQLLAKPFDLQQFGETVQQLLSSRRGAGAPATLRKLSLADHVALHCLAGTTGILHVEKSKRRTGEIHTSAGQITHAAAPRCEGAEALREMLRWRSPQITPSEERPSSTRSFRGPWFTNLADALAAIEESEPAAEPQHPPEPESEPERPAAAPPPPPVRNGNKIVIIDDTEMLLIYAEEMLLAADPSLQLSTASTGEAGAKLVAEKQPDLVLLDYSLPDINGDEVCRRLLDNPATATTPVLMMSGHVPEMTATAARYRNVVAALPKPFLSAQLVALVTETLANPPTIERAPVAPAPPPIAEPPPLAEPKPIVEALPPAPPAAPPPPPPEPSPAAQPIIAMTPATRQPLFTGLSPATIPMARQNTVVLALPLEVLSMQFSSALRIAAIRARPSVPMVKLHLDPEALPGAVVPEAGFHLARVELDARGQFNTLYVSPNGKHMPVLQSRTEFPVGAVAVLPANGGKAMELTPAPVAPMRMELIASFELTGVELTVSFTLAALVLRSRGGPMRVSLHPEDANTGATFETAQVLLDRSGRIAEILLDALALPESSAAA